MAALPSSSTPRSSVAVAVIGMVAVCVAAVALQNAVKWYGHPFPGLLITADGNVSSIGMPNWSGIDQGLRFPDGVLSIDDVPVVSVHGEYAARAWDRVVSEAAAEGRPSVHVHVATATGERELDLRLERLDPASWWLYAGTLIFVGSLYALAGIIALVTSPKGPLARSFAKFAFPVAMFFLTFFDAHTTRVMVPVFHASFAWLPFALTALALRLPDDVALFRRHQWPFVALEVAGLLLAAVVVARDLVGSQVTQYQPRAPSCSAARCSSSWP